MKTIRKKLHILMITAIITHPSFGMNQTMLNLLEPSKKFKLLGTEETVIKLKKIAQEAKTAHQKFSQKNRRSNLGSYVNTLGPYTLIALCGGYLAKRGLRDHQISFYDLGFCIVGTTSSLLWFLKKEKIQQQLGGKVKTAQNHYNTTFKRLREKFGKIVGTNMQQKRTCVQEEQKAPTPERYALKDVPPKLPALFSLNLKRELIQLRKVKQQLDPFAQNLGRYWKSFDEFIERNSPGNRNSVIVSDGDDNTDEEITWETKNVEKRKEETDE